MSVMAVEQRQEFLAGPHVGVLSVARDGRPPLAVPVWYSYEPGGEVLVQVSPGSLKYRLVEAAGEFSLVAQQEALPYRYVSVSGPLVAVEKTQPDELEAMARRYMPPEHADEYLRQMEGEPIVTLRMKPKTWYSTDYSG